MDRRCCPGTCFLSLRGREPKEVLDAEYAIVRHRLSGTGKTENYIESSKPDSNSLGIHPLQLGKPSATMQTPRKSEERAECFTIHDWGFKFMVYRHQVHEGFGYLGFGFRIGDYRVEAHRFSRFCMPSVLGSRF